jgi:hypothetical protein
LEIFGSKLRNQEFRWYEREKKIEEFEMIDAIVRSLPDFVREYGGTPVEGLSPETIHVLDTTKLSSDELNRLGNEDGWYLFHVQEGVVMPDDNSQLLMAQRIVHEILHLESYMSLEVHDNAPATTDPHSIAMGGKQVRVRRIGLSIAADYGASLLFHDLDEAIIEELTKRFDEQHFGKIRTLQKEYERRAEFLREYASDADVDIAAITSRQAADGRWESTAPPYGYQKERGRLRDLIHDLYRLTKDRFASEEEIFRMFARASLSGNLLSVGRLIENALGKGSLRRLAEATKKHSGI